MGVVALFALIVLIAGIVIGFSGPKSKGVVAITAILLLVSISSFMAIRALVGQPFQWMYSGSFVTGPVPVVVDTLSAWFILVINFTFVTGAFYGHYYLKAYQMPSSKIALHWIYFVLVYGSLTATCAIQNMLVFLIAWEVMAVGAFFLVIFESDKSKTLKAGINYLIQSHIVVLFLTIAFIWVYTTTGSFSFEAISQFSATAKPYRSFFLMILFMIGFGTKAGFIPFHTWLPHAHPAAPSHISGIMSGVLVKIGIYGIFRIATYMHQDYELIGIFILLLSLSSGLFGIINAAIHRDIKKMLAYCTIENIGILGIGIGLGFIGLGTSNYLLIFLGFGSALLHTFNHSLIKSLLFFSAGSLYQQTHTRDMEKLGGLIKQMPQTAMLFLVGSLAIGGMPPLNAFISEFLLYSGLVKGLMLPGSFNMVLMVTSMAVLAVIGGISIFAFSKFFGVVFLGTPKTSLYHKPHEVSLGMRLPQYAVIVAIVTVVLFPSFYLRILSTVVAAAFPRFQAMPLAEIEAITSIIQWVGWYSLLFIILILGVYAIRKLITKKQTETIHATWGCGYVAPNAAMQYTGKSFSKTLAKLLYFFVPEKKKYQELRSYEIFPAKRNHSTYYSDFFEQVIIDNLIQYLLNFMNFFQFIQNGKLQRYILYGLFFIIAILLGLAFTLVYGIFS